MSGVSEAQPLKKRLSAQDKTEEKSPKGSPISVEQFVEGLGNIFDKFEKSESLAMVSNIECDKAKELYERDIKFLMETNFKSREDAFGALQIVLKRSFNGLAPRYNHKSKNGLVQYITVMKLGHIKT